MTVLADGLMDVVSAFVLSAYFQVMEKQTASQWSDKLGSSHTKGMGHTKSSCCCDQLISNNISDGAKVQNS